MKTSHEARGSCSMTTALGTGLWHTINGGVPLDVWSIEMIATIGAFESDCSSYHKNVLYIML